MTEKKATTKNTVKKVADQKPKTVQLEINLDEFYISDYEAILSFSQGDFSRYSVSDVFDILDRLIVGGFRTRKFIDSKNVVVQLLEKLKEVSQSKN